VLGRDHALLGAVAALAGANLAWRAMGHPALPIGQIAAACPVVAGFALLPDIDEPGSTVSRRLGPLSRTVSKATNKLAGGHRAATHSLLFVALVFLGMWGAERAALAATITVGATAALSIGMIVPARFARHGFVVGVLAPAAAAWATWEATVHAGQHWAWLPWAAAAGVALHLIGDMLTVEGVPLLWPLRWHQGIPLLGHTDSLREQLTGAVMTFAVMALVWIELLRKLV
jgi:membrane-bound metal-dependent hydrolase YbcI (DUF457 family)